MNTIEDAWRDVAQQAQRLKPIHLRQLFENSARFDQYHVRFNNTLLDYSKEKVDEAAMQALFSLARACEVESQRDAMFCGELLNHTEQRAVLHTALRGSVDAAMQIDGQNVKQQVDQELERFLGFAESVRSGRYSTSAGVPFTDVVNIGIGGSDLGPAMVTEALSPWHDGPKVHFVSNVDAAHLTDILSTLDASRTLVIVASKTFTTLETMMNFDTAVAWLKSALGEQCHTHLAAVSTNLAGTAEYGIDDSRVFGFWDWVGGRYSVWSAIGLPIAIAIGAANFKAFLSGAQEMDIHFKTAPLENNLPVLYALLGIWRRNAMGYPALALIPYDQRLARFTAYIQQLDMESNGKSVTREDTQRVACSTGPLVWGEPGTNSQHSFFQLLHQGTDVIPVDFIASANGTSTLHIAGFKDHHQALLGNMLAQSQALAFGRTEAEVREAMAQEGVDSEQIERLALHRSFDGDRPSTTIIIEQLTPHYLGQLLALYEHKVFVQGMIWNVNSYDQWGVELGKKLAKDVMQTLTKQETSVSLDHSTQGLINHLHQLQG